MLLCAIIFVIFSEFSMKIEYTAIQLYCVASYSNTTIYVDRCQRQLSRTVCVTIYDL